MTCGFMIYLFQIMKFFWGTVIEKYTHTKSNNFEGVKAPIIVFPIARITAFRANFYFLLKDLLHLI